MRSGISLNDGNDKQGGQTSGKVELLDMEALLPDKKGMVTGVVRVAVALAVIIVVLAAFLWEALLGRKPVESVEVLSRPGQENNSGNFPPRGRSLVQDSLSDLDWVTPAFLPVNEYSRPDTLINEVNAVVIHYIGNPGTTAMQNRNYFENLRNTKETYASSNFIVGLDGEILQCVPVDEVAYASNTRNDDTVSIELCHPDETGMFTEETYLAAVRLTKWLCEQFGLSSEHIIRHYDVSGKECPRYFVENEEAWEQFKTDVMEFSG